MFRIMLDIDGVLSDFVKKFLEFAQKTFPDREIENSTITQWNFQNILTQEEVDTVWETIKMQNNFWESLDSLVTQTDKKELELKFRNGAKIFAISNRDTTMKSPSSRPVLIQTVRWFDKFIGIIPPIIFTDAKDRTCVDLGITHAIDDDPKNVELLTNVGINVAVMDRPYNKIVSENILRVSSIYEFLSLL